MSLPRYPEYKDSEVPWLGEIPAHWLIAPVKRLGKLKGGSGFPHAEQGVEAEELPFHKVNALGRAGSDGLLWGSENNISRATAERLGAYIFPSGALVFAKVGAALLLGRIRMLGEAACIDNNMMGLVVDDAAAEAAFVSYALNLVRFDLIANPGAVPSLNEGQIGNFQLVLPNRAEQHAIATFLDRETAKIDALIAEQEKLLMLLAEKRQATISQAVTRGLNPNAPMKDSGIPWLGEVPAHWEFKRIKDGGCEIVDCKNRTPELHPEGDYFVVRTSCVKNGEFSYEEGFFTNRANFLEWTAKGRPQAGDVLFTREAPTGEACLAPEHIDFCLGQRMMYIRPPANVLSSKFLLYAIYGAPVREKIDLKSKGSTVGHLRVGEVGELPLLLPPLSEQGEIVVFLDAEIDRLNALAFEAGRASRLFKERRSALIASAVTGKIDVRQVA